MTKYIFAISVAVFALTPAVSAECVRGSEKGLRVSWTAFKTPAKVGVKGYLRGLKSKGPKKADSWQELVLGQTLNLASDATSVDSKNKPRDAKIAKFFFSKMKGQIQAKVTKINETKKLMTLSVTMNGKTLDNVSMAFTREDDVLKASGHIDILDFAADKALASINKACAALHKGKTWSHVEIGFDAKFKSCK